MRYLIETDAPVEDVALTVLLQKAGIENISLSIGTRRSDFKGRTFITMGKPTPFPRALTVNYDGDEGVAVQIINQYIQEND